MQLKPKQPPGRMSRKVRAFGDEIRRLQLEGYTCQAIREALAEAGVQVSRSTVQREGVRVSRRQTLNSVPAAPPVASPGPPPPLVQGSRQPPHTSSPADPRRGKEIADSFFKDRISNPLVRKRIEDEARRD